MKVRHDRGIKKDRRSFSIGCTSTLVRQVICAAGRISATRIQVILSAAAAKMSLFKPTSDERDTLKKAVVRFAHDPIKSQLLSHLDVEDAEYSHGSEEWNHLKFCVEQHHLHAQTELRRDPKKKPSTVPSSDVTFGPRCLARR